MRDSALQISGKREVLRTFSQPFSSPKFEVFLFSAHDFGNVLMFLERVVVYMFMFLVLFFLTGLCGIFEAGKTKWCRRLTHIKSRDKKPRRLHRAHAL